MEDVICCACKRELQVIHTKKFGENESILDLCTTPEDVVECKKLWDARFAKVSPRHLCYVDDLWKSYTERRERWLKS
jgi:hypothetical protein